MKLTVKNGLIKQINPINWLCFEINNYDNKLLRLLENEFLEIDIKKKGEKRSLQANAYMFALLSQLSKKLGNSLGNQYVMAIKDYGQIVEGMAMHKKVLPTFESDYNAKATSLQHTLSLVDVTNEFTSKGVEWVEVIVYRGSSMYDPVEFSKLLNGVVSDCLSQDIETLPPEELNRLMKEYEV